MATDQVQAPTNGVNGHAESKPEEVGNSEVAWYFVEQYYKTLSATPDKLYLFFNKRSQYVSGVEAEKVSVAIGQKAINERIKEFNFSDTKVRVNNVDSQTSDSAIVIQVIGEMTTKSQEPKKFVQTFVLAAQSNGWFVLNDIFRYIRDEEEEEVAATSTEQSEPVAEAAQEAEESMAEVNETEAPAPSAATVTDDKAVEQVDQELEQVAKTQEPPSVVEAETNGTHEEEEVSAPASADVDESAPNVAEEVAEETIAEPEKPKDPAPSPKAAPAQPKPAAATPSAPPKPAVPKSWAQLAAGSRAAAAAAAAAPANTSSQSVQTPSTQAKAVQQTQSQAPQAAAPSVAAPVPAQSAPAREASPVSSQKAGSEEGWQMAGDNHGRKNQQRGAPVQPVQQENRNGTVRAYVKNVTERVDENALKEHLAQFNGSDLPYFDMARAKNACFVEFSTRAGFQKAVAANPHKIGEENVFVEERNNRPQGAGGFRGGRGGPRGGLDGGRPQGGRGGFRPDGPGRGGPQMRGGRGGGAPRGRGAPAAA